MRKKFIHDRIFEKFGLRVDEPRAGGSGTSNARNLCRRAFSDPLLLRKTLEIVEEIITRLHYILIAINCKEPIDLEKIDKYCNDTYEKLLEKFDWFKVPASIHKVLAHAGEIIINSPVPLGLMGGEAIESRHRVYKFDREHHARKKSRETKLHNIFIRAIQTSDPLISSISLTK